MSNHRLKSSHTENWRSSGLQTANKQLSNTWKSDIILIHSFSCPLKGKLLPSKLKHLQDSDFRSHFQAMKSKWRDRSLQYRILFYRPKKTQRNAKPTPTKKTNPTNKQSNNKKLKLTRQMYSHSWYFFPPNMHILLQVLGMGSIQQTWMFQILVEAYTLSSSSL